MSNRPNRATRLVASARKKKKVLDGVARLAIERLALLRFGAAAQRRPTRFGRRPTPLGNWISGRRVARHPATCTRSLPPRASGAQAAGRRVARAAAQRRSHASLRASLHNRRPFAPRLQIALDVDKLAYTKHI